MKLIKHKKQVIGYEDGDKGRRYVCGVWGLADKATLDSALKSDTSLELDFLIYAPEEEEPKLIRFARPLAFRLDRVKAKVTQVTQPDLPLRTTADPATLLQDIAFELIELDRAAQDPVYSDSPDFAATVTSFRALVCVTSLDAALSKPLEPGARRGVKRPRE